MELPASSSERSQQDNSPMLTLVKRWLGHDPKFIANRAPPQHWYKCKHMYIFLYNRTRYCFKYFWPPYRPSEARACSGNSWRSLQFQLQKTKHGNLLLVWFVKANRYMDVHWLSTEGGKIFHLSWKCQIRKRSICFRQFDPGNKGLEKVVRTRWQIEIRKLRSHHESKHAPCQQVWPRRGDQSIGVGKNKVARSGKNRGKKSSYRSPLNSRNIGQEGRILQTQDVVNDIYPSFC